MSKNNSNNNSDAMDIDPPVPTPSTEPTPAPTPSGSGSTSTSTPGASSSTAGTGPSKPTASGKGKAPDPAQDDAAEAAAEAAAQAALLAGIPEPDVKDILSKQRLPGTHIDGASLSSEQLLALVDKALKLKDAGNKAFTSKPPQFDVARDDYLSALDCLPCVPKHLPLPAPHEDRIREVTDEEAEQIELDFLAGPARIRADNAVRDAQKALWGNLGAVFSKQTGKDKETVDACTQALKIDPKYEKALLRRAAANERIGTWSSLVAAQNDCAVLMTLLSPDADALIPVRKALDVLPRKIADAKKKESSDIVGQMGSL